MNDIVFICTRYAVDAANLTEQIARDLLKDTHRVVVLIGEPKSVTLVAHVTSEITGASLLRATVGVVINIDQPPPMPPRLIYFKTFAQEELYPTTPRSDTDQSDIALYFLHNRPAPDGLAKPLRYWLDQAYVKSFRHPTRLLVCDDSLKEILASEFVEFEIRAGRVDYLRHTTPRQLEHPKEYYAVNGVPFKCFICANWVQCYCLGCGDGPYDSFTVAYCFGNLRAPYDDYVLQIEDTIDKTLSDKTPTTQACVLISARVAAARLGMVQ